MSISILVDLINKLMIIVYLIPSKSTHKLMASIYFIPSKSTHQTHGQF